MARGMTVRHFLFTGAVLLRVCAGDTGDRIPLPQGERDPKLRCNFVDAILHASPTRVILSREREGSMKVLAVTGGGQGIGRSIAYHFAQHGYAVSIADEDKQ